MKKIIWIIPLLSVLLVSGWGPAPQDQATSEPPQLASSIVTSSQEAGQKHGSGSGLLIVAAVGAIMGFTKLRQNRKQQQAAKQRLAALFSEMPGTPMEKIVLLAEIKERFLAFQTGWGQVPVAEMARHCTPKMTGKHANFLTQVQQEYQRLVAEDLEIINMKNFRQIRDNSFSVDIDFRFRGALLSKEGTILAGHPVESRRLVKKVFFDRDEKDLCWKVDFVQTKAV